MDEDLVGFADTKHIWRQARAALSSSPIHTLRNLDIQHSGNSLVITGRVHSFYEKQQAQELIRNVIGKCDLVNSVDVHSENDY